jgi:hypothetical protein
MDTVRVSGPVVKIDDMKLVRYIDAKGMGERDRYEFTHEILWVRQVTPTVSFWHGVQKVKDGGMYCDVGGFMNGIDAAVKAAQRCCEFYDVKMDSTMRVLVAVTVENVAVLRQRNGEKREILFGLHDYPAIPRGWLIEGSEEPLANPGQVLNTIIWTSIMADAVNTLSVQKFKERWNVPSLIEQR